MATEWTVETLKEHFDEILRAREKSYSERFQAQEAAISKAEKSQQDYNQQHNDLQRKMEAERKDMLPRAEFTAYKESNEKAQAIEKTRADKGEGKGVGMTQFWGYLIGAVALAIAIINFITKLPK